MAVTPARSARSGRFGSYQASGWTTRISALCRHSRGVRSMVQATMEMINTTSPTLNQAELNTWNSCRRSSRFTVPVPRTGSYNAWSLSISFA